MRDPISLSAFTLKRGLARVVAWGVVCFERLWPLIQPFLLIAGMFVALAWLGLFSVLGSVAHFIILAIFFAATVFALIPLRRFHLPTRRDIDRRIEKESGLPLSTLQIDEDHLPPENVDPTSERLWREHQGRTLKKIGHLRTGFPAPDMPRHDPYALRSLVWLFVAVAAFVGFSPAGGQWKDAFDFSPPVDTTLMRVDAWVTPPVYTNEAPIYLSRDDLRDAPVNVPQGSEVTLHIANGGGVDVQMKPEDGRKSTIGAKKQTGIDKTYQVQLDKNTALTLSARHYKRTWNFTVTPDRPPHIALIAEPARILNGSLELKYKIDDDYGAVKGWADIAATKESRGHALYDAPKVTLQLPPGGKGEARTVQELASHPWAGSEVTITLFVEDGAGHIARTEPRTMTLPQKTFGNPLARALAEQRRIFVRNTFERNRVLDMLSALLVRPADTIKNATNVIALRSIWTRLSYAVSDDMFRDVADYMWQVALGIEGSDVDQAKARLREAQAALRDALRNGTSPEEIERLMKELRAAMDNYIAALAQSKDKNELSQTPPKNMQTLGEDDLIKKLKQLEDLAKTGDRAAAEQLLSELEQMMDNLQLSPGGSGMAGGENQHDDMRKKLDELNDLMRRQQNMLDKTYELQKELGRGDKTPDQYNKEMENLQQKQQDMQSELRNLQKELETQGIKPNDFLKDAERQMGEAAKGLGNSQGDKAIGEQTDALNSMREGTQKLMDSIKEAMKGEGGKNKKAATDPLGRTLSEPGQTDLLPNETNIERARRILEEIRKKLGETFTPEMEKQYLERLLKFD